MKTKLTYEQVFFFPFFVHFGDASANFLFRSMVISIPLSKESGGDEEGSATGSERREGVGFTERGEEELLEAAERESERRAGIRCRGGSGRAQIEQILQGHRY